jgi:hypothetical protein
MRTVLGLAAAGLVVGFGGIAQATVTSGFTFSTDGWTVITSYPIGSNVLSYGSAPWNAVGGNPGGYVSILDPDDNDTYFRAPAAFLGNQSAAVGGTLAFDRIMETGAIDYSQNYDVMLQGGGRILQYELPMPSQLTLWQTYQLTLAPSAGWFNVTSNTAATLADFQAVLSSLTELWLLAEFTNGQLETIGIDNVVLTDGQGQPAPEPASVALLLSALGPAALVHVCRPATGPLHAR